MDIIKEYSASLDKTVAHLKEELQTIRTGRPSSTILESMQVDTYGGTMKMKLMEMATITNEGATTLVIQPFDPSTVQDIEKAILKSPLNLTPKVQGQRILVVFPELSMEQREKFVKLVGQHVEEHRIKIRGQRDEIRKDIKALFDTKEITEDDKFRMEKDIDAATTKKMDEMQVLKEKKEQQIREI